MVRRRSPTSLLTVGLGRIGPPPGEGGDLAAERGEDAALPSCFARYRLGDRSTKLRRFGSALRRAQRERADQIAIGRPRLLRRDRLLWIGRFWSS
jgi:hypothetical protein